MGDYLPYVEAVPAYNIVRSQYHPKALVPYHQGQANLQEVLTRSLKGAGIDAQVMKLP